MATCNCCGNILTVVCPEDCPETQVYTFQNVNLIGIGVLDGVSGFTVDLRGVASGNSMIVATLDAANNAILLTADSSAIAAALPQATTAQRGVGETATDAEAQAKASATTFLTPSNLAALGSSQTFAGLIEIATNAEAITGTSTTLAITPASLTAVLATVGETVVFADAVARAAAVPAFVGQFGAQVDTVVPYLSGGLTPGAWSSILILDNPAVQSTSGTSIDIPGGGFWNFGSSDATGFLNFTNGLEATFDGCVINLNGPSVEIAGVPIPAASVIVTAGAATLSSQLLNTFISGANTQTGYTPVSNGATIRTYDCNTVTLPQLAQAVGTLMADLVAAKMPAV